MAGDLTTSPLLTPGQQGVDASNFNNLVLNATIKSSFITSKATANSPAITDQILIARADGTFAQISYAAFVSGIIGVATPRGNTVINGDTSRWARGTSFVSPADGTYTAERWRIRDATAGTGRVTFAQGASGLPGSVSPFYPSNLNALIATVTVAQPVLAAGNVFAIEQRIERQMARLLFDQTSSLQLLLKTNLPGNYSITLFNADSTQRFTTVATLPSSTWTQVTIPNIPALPTASGSWGTLETDWAYTIHVGLASGTSFQSATTGAWVADALWDATGQANLLATIGNYLAMTLVQHEPGAVCSPYQWLPVTTQELLCARYYQKTYDYLVAPGTVASLGQRSFPIVSATLADGFDPFTPRMRIAPVAAGIGLFSPITGAGGVGTANWQTRDYLGATDRVPTATNAGESGLDTFSGYGALTASTAGYANRVIFHRTADVEL